jgi:ADP-ribose pyrophosphatase
VKPDSERTIYEGKVVVLRIERWGDHEREIVVHSGAVTILAVDRDDNVILVRQLREPARHTLLELPAGGLEQAEEPLAAAQRELREETGLHGGEWREAARFYTAPGFCTEYMPLFFAEGVEAGDASPEDDEDLEVVRWPARDLDRLLPELEDAKTLAGILLYLRESVSFRRPR